MTNLSDQGAVLSNDDNFRYRLWRKTRATSGSTLVFVMLNPSTADAHSDDATIRRCLGYADRGDHTWLEVVNLYGWRATNPKDLLERQRADKDVIGPMNHKAIVRVVSRADRVVVAWGNLPKACEPQAKAVLSLLRWFGPKPILCLGKTKSGHPRHPSRGPYRSFVPYDSPTATLPG